MNASKRLWLTAASSKLWTRPVPPLQNRYPM